MERESERNDQEMNEIHFHCGGARRALMEELNNPTAAVFIRFLFIEQIPLIKDKWN